MGQVRSRLTTIRAVVALALLGLLGSAIVLTHATMRVWEANELAATRTEQVHDATLVFVDWLATEAVDRKLDAMTLRRVALLEATRAHRIQGLAGLTVLLCSVLLLLAHTARLVHSGVERLPDVSLATDTTSLSKKRRRSSNRGRKTAANLKHLGLELSRHPVG